MLFKHSEEAPLLITTKTSDQAMMRPWRLLLIAVAFAVAHFVAYFALFGAVHDYAMANRDAPLLVQVPFAILGAPLVYLLELPPSAFGKTRWWGDDSNFLSAFSFVTPFCGVAFLLWGFAGSSDTKAQSMHQLPNQAMPPSASKPAIHAVCGPRLWVQGTLHSARGG